MRAAVPLLQQTSDEKLPVAELKERGISTLTLHYSQARAQDIRYTHTHTHSERQQTSAFLKSVLNIILKAFCIEMQHHNHTAIAITVKS